MPVNEHDTAPKGPVMLTLWQILGLAWVLLALWVAAIVCGVW